MLQHNNCSIDHYLSHDNKHSEFPQLIKNEINAAYTYSIAILIK